MANNRSNKISFISDGRVPLLYMADNKPKIDTTFQNVSKNNSPYVNEIIQPFYSKKIEGDSVYDRFGNRYYIKDSHLYKNDTALSVINNKMFQVEDVTEEYIKYLSFDIKNNKIAYLEINDQNVATLYYDGAVVNTETIFSTGAIITTRVHIIGNKPVGVIVYRNQDNMRCLTVLTPSHKHTAINFPYYTQVIKNNANDGNNIKVVDVPKSYPFINICKVGENIGVSLISNFGSLLTSTYNNKDFNEGIYTVLLKSDGSVLTYGKDWLPSTTSQQQVVETTYNNYFSTSFGVKKSTTEKQAIRDENGIFYKYDNYVKGEIIDFGDKQIPSPAGYKVTVDGVAYDLFRYIEYTVTNRVGVASLGPGLVGGWRIQVVWDNDTQEGTTNDKSIILETTTTSLSSSYNNDPKKITVYWNNQVTEIPNDKWGQNYYVEYSETTTNTVGSLTHPNVFLDSGEMVAFYTFNYGSKQSYTTGNYITETANLTSYDTNYTWTIIESVPISKASLSFMSIGRNFAQNFYTMTGRLGDIAFATASPTSGLIIEFNNTNANDLKYNPGTMNAPYYSYYNNGIYASGNTDMEVCYSPYGYRPRMNEHFNTLVNTSQDGSSYVWGISYSNDEDEMGTLLTEWQNVDENFYIIFDGEYFIYRDRYNKLFKVSIVDGNQLKAIIDDRYIIVNTTSYFNCYDSVLERLTHYASDYNGRVIPGSSTYAESDYQTKARTVATGINTSITDENEIATDNDRIISLLLPSANVFRVGVDKDWGVVKCKVPYTSISTTKGIDVYYSDLNRADNASYRYTLRADGIASSYKKFELAGTSYTNSKNILLSPNIFTRYINGAGNNDYVKEGTSSYPLVYWNSQPILLYNPIGMVENVDSFFVLQGQYYAVINNKIYSAIYNNGGISQIDAIVDIKGFKFLGNTPSIAFFWSDKLRAIFSFTGDANLSHLWDAGAYEVIENNFYYDESTQSIFIPTKQGVLVLGTKNSYVMEQFKNVSNIQFSDNLIHLMDSGNTYNLSYYNKDGYEPVNVVIETLFFGLGNNETGSIDRFSITLYNPQKLEKSISVKLKTTSITDVVTASEEKTLEIKPNEWDKISNSALINFNPKIIKGQGLKLFIESPVAISNIVIHISDQGNSTLTKGHLMA